VTLNIARRVKADPGPERLGSQTTAGQPNQPAPSPDSECRSPRQRIQMSAFGTLGYLFRQPKVWGITIGFGA
jgi:hypothetical protein